MRAVWLALIACAACNGKKSEEGVSAQSPPRPSQKGGLPETGPHPDYPTAAAAGTDKIFFLEEPDRGPKAPGSFTRPANLAWTRMAYCEAYEKTSSCSTGSGEWYVGKAKGVTIVERRRGSTVDSATAYVSDADGAVTQRIALDARGQVTGAYLFTQPGRYTGRNRDGGNSLDGCGMVAFTDDKQGRVVESRCLQWLGDPMRDTSGVAVRNYVLDARGFNQEWTNHGTDGAPVDDTTGVHKVVQTRDAAGRVVMKQWFGKDGARVITTSGCAGAKLEYDGSGRMTRQTCLDTADAAIGDHDGVAQSTYEYDDDGCEAKRRFFDAKGRPAANAYGVHGRNYTANAQCEDTLETCVDIKDNARACSPTESGRLEYTRDARGRVTSTKHYEPSGAQGEDPSYHVFEQRFGYDDAGHVTQMTCHDVTGTAVECGNTGFHGWHADFDDAGRMMSQMFFDKDGGAATNMGTFKRSYRYDNYDHQYEARALDQAGKVIESRGMAIRRNLWDATHRLFAIQLFDAAEKPAKYSACYVGATCPEDKPWHAVRINRRADGRVLTNQFFDADGQLIETVDCRAKPCFDGA